MSRFVEFDGMYLNTDDIKSYYQDTANRLHVELTDGSEVTTSPRQAVYIMKELSGECHIVQVIPVAEPMYAVYEDEQSDSYFAIPVYYLALCADGVIRGADCCDGWFECVSIEHGNCRGLYHRDQLNRFPGAIDSVTPKEAAQ
ncbi:MAG: hypothetical protein K2N78_03625 [Oscillospiraceae bacterium]|nr:hypothetical protein [Oscillospiraceae bacterium]